jgi:hypothetical protein
MKERERELDKQSVLPLLLKFIHLELFLFLL